LVYLPAQNREAAECMIKNYQRLLELIAEVSEVQAQLLNCCTKVSSEGEKQSSGLENDAEEE
jgi:hypothetical protein